MQHQRIRATEYGYTGKVSKALRNLFCSPVAMKWSLLMLIADTQSWHSHNHGRVDWMRQPANWADKTTAWRAGSTRDSSEPRHPLG